MRVFRSGFRMDAMRRLFLALLLTAALEAQSASAAGKVVADADNGGAVHLKVGETLIVRLRSNPSTGYLWYVTAKSTPLVKLVRQMEIDNTGPAVRPETGAPALPRLGRPVVQVFEFVAVRAGQGVLRLHYVRSWEKPASNEERFELRVAIE